MKKYHISPLKIKWYYFEHCRKLDEEDFWGQNDIFQRYLIISKWDDSFFDDRIYFRSNELF